MSRGAVVMMLARVIGMLARYGLTITTVLIVPSLIVSGTQSSQWLPKFTLIGWLASYGAGLLVIFLFPEVYRVQGRSWLEDMFDRRSGINGYFPEK
jgi:hypothetical protein